MAHLRLLDKALLLLGQRLLSSHQGNPQRRGVRVDVEYFAHLQKESVTGLRQTKQRPSSVTQEVKRQVACICRTTRAGDTDFWTQSCNTCWASSLVGSTTSARMWQTTRCNRACRDRNHLCHWDPPCRATAGNLCPHTHLYHGDDKGQCFPTASWGRDAEITRLVATPAYEKPMVSTFEEGGNHSCLD